MKDSSDYGYQDSLSMDTGGLPSKERVKWAVKALEVGWLEGLRIKAYYAWSRFKANLTVRLVWWVLVGGAALAFMAFVLLTLAFAVGEMR